MYNRQHHNDDSYDRHGDGKHHAGMDRLGHMLEKHDADKDGSITKEEMTSTAAKIFIAADKNADQRLDKEELRSMHEGKQAHGKKHKKMHVFSKMDSDGDKYISADEFAAMAQKVFAKMDRNADGVINAHDRKRKHDDSYDRHGDGKHHAGMDRLGHMLEKHDADKDGSITKEEMTSTAAKIFIAADKNADQKLDKEELRSMHEGKQAHGKKHKKMHVFSKMDSDGDKHISADEFAVMARKVFAKMDRNADGVINAHDRMHKHDDSYDRHGDGKHHAGMNRLGHMLEKHDADKDGSITKEEMTSTAAKIFIAADKNADQKLDKEELRSMHEDKQAHGKKHKKMHVFSKMAKMHSDGDKHISADEFAVMARKVFAKMDRNADGVINAHDRMHKHDDSYDRHGDGKHHAGMNRLGHMLEKHDADKDGSITKEEMTSTAAKIFIAADKNADQKLDKEELRSMHEGKQAHGKKHKKMHVFSKMAKMHSDGDKHISADEFAVMARKVFAKMDRNADGVINAHDRMHKHERMHKKNQCEKDKH